MQWKFELLMRPSTVPLTEGPVWDGEHLYFTHIPASRIMRYDLKTNSITEWRTGTNRTNGLAFDAQGRLFGCCSGGVLYVLCFSPVALERGKLTLKGIGCCAPTYGFYLVFWMLC